MYCTRCGNTGIDINGNICTCKQRVKTFYDTISCLQVPEQYRGVTFNKALVPTDVHSSYGDYLEEVHDAVSLMRWSSKNVLIASPLAHSKSIMAYSCIEKLYANGTPVFPLMDVLELKRIMMDLDFCRKPLYEVEDPESLLTVPILFTKVPRALCYELYDTMALLLDRRVRRGFSTIFLFDGSYAQLASGDKRDLLASLAGDGTYTTLEIKSWSPIVSEKKEIVDDYMG